MNSRPVHLPGPIDANLPIYQTPQKSGTLVPNNDFRKLVEANKTETKASTIQDTHITISAHARERLKLRNISLNDDDMKKISEAMDRIADKGGKQSLLFVKTSNGNQTAMVVNARNRVVITAVDTESLRDNIFTNIDSAAIVH
jgi:flagellar operon protein